MTDAITGRKRYVPRWQKVHSPEWSAHFHDPDTGPHDLPLKNGITGEIGLEIEAITPLFVGAKQEDVKDDRNDAGKRKHWLTLGKTRAIQGSAIKGAMRSVLQIATFGRFGTRIDDRRLSMRDLHNHEDYVRHLTDMFRPLSRAGWLTPSRRGWSLQPCKWSLVRQTDLEKLRSGKVDLGRSQSAQSKYDQWGWNRLDINFDPLPEDTEGAYAKGRLLSRVARLGNGSTSGRIVFTGQPQNRSSRKAKASDFIFYGDDGPARLIHEHTQRDFEQIHRDATGEPNAEWKMWLSKALEGQSVPVFWLENDDGSIRALGLAMMFRLPLAKSLREAAKQNGEEDWDMADLIFGRLDDRTLSDDDQKGGLDLKGRASFSHFLQQCKTPLMPEQEAVLLAPKYGFYPANIRQQNIAPGSPAAIHTYRESAKGQPRKLYTTLQDPKAELRGPSRFVASRSFEIPSPEPHKGKINRKIVTRIRPVKSGARFRGSLRIFNLDPRELGALLWILTWGGDKEGGVGSSPSHAHMVGAGKSFGLGACRITIRLEATELMQVSDTDPYSSLAGQATERLLADCLAQFRDHMKREVDGWEHSPQVKELLTLADLDHGDAMAKSGALKPMRGPAPFVEAKKVGLVLPLASGGYEVAASAPPTQPVQQRHPGARTERPKPARPLWRRGDFAMLISEGVEVELLENVGPGSNTALIRFVDDDDEEEVAVSDLAKA